VFLFYTVSLLDILHLSFSMELPRLFVVVESSGQVESCPPKKMKCCLSLKFKKFALCGSSVFFLVCVLVCVLVLLHLFLLVVVSLF
jgi:hypothetical protein